MNSTKDLSFDGRHLRTAPVPSAAVCASMRLLLVLLAVGSMTACAASLPSGGAPQPGTYVQPTPFYFNVFQRDYRVHVPRGYDGSRAFPLVVVIHGAFSSGKEMERCTGFSQLADREGFVALYPNGIGLFGWLRHWNSGHCCAKAREAGVDDVGFLDGVIRDATERLNIDMHRIYVAGHSNGGMMTYRYVAERSESIAAAAVVAGTIGGKPSADEPEWRIPKPVRPVPMIILHGTADKRIPYAGGPDPAGSEMTWISAADSARFWADCNGCPTPPVEKAMNGGRVRTDTWAPCSNDISTQLYTLNGWGHAWPGPHFKDHADPYPGDDFDAAALIWHFFSDYRCP
jgi:polyhydroxybutyrate depolymerase